MARATAATPRSQQAAKASAAANARLTKHPPSAYPVPAARQSSRSRGGGQGKGAWPEGFPKGSLYDIRDYRAMRFPATIFAGGVEMAKRAEALALRSKRRRRVLWLAGILVAASLAALGLARALVEGPLRVELVGLGEREERAFLSALKSQIESGSVVLARTSPSGLLRRFAPPDLVLARLSEPRRDARTVPVHSYEPSLRSRLSPPLAVLADTYEAYPLLIDGLETAWHRPTFSGKRLSPPLDADALSLAAKTLVANGRPVILFAGGDDETLLLLVSALCAAKGGERGYQAAVTALRSAKVGHERDTLTASPELSVAITELRSWRASGFLHEEWDRLSKDFIVKTIEASPAPIVFQTLSDRRSVPYQAIFDYASGSFPSYGHSRVLVAPVTGAYIQSTGSRRERALLLLTRLSSPDGVLALALSSGKAPAPGASKAPDSQAAALSSLAASSEAIVAGLFLDCFSDAAAARPLAEAIRAAVRD